MDMSENPCLVKRILKSQYYGLACADIDCCKESATLKACGRCHRAYYCNAQCQRQDWKFHKPICKALTAVMEIVHDMPIETSMQRYSNIDTAKWELAISRDSANVGVDLHHWFLNDRTCGVCFKSPFHFGHNGKDWYRCPKCRCGWCCSKDHWELYKAQHTPEICQRYQESLEDEMFLKQHQINYNDDFMFVPERSSTKIMKSFPKTWDEYYQKRCPNRFAQRNLLPRSFFPCATHLGSQICTVLHGIDEMGLLKTFNIKNSMQLHVIGAAPMYEWPPTCIWEEILHVFPNLIELDVLFVGPEVSAAETTYNEGETVQMETCPDCSKRGRLRKCSHFQGTYHEYKLSSYFNPPDLCVAFNTGLYEVDSDGWKTSLENLLEMNVPCIFTSYDVNEVRKDVEVLRTLNANIIMEPKLNPFRCQSYKKDPEDTDKFFQINAYMYCFQGSSMS